MDEINVLPIKGSETTYPNQPDPRLPQKHCLTLVAGGRFVGKSSLINSVLRRYLIQKYSMIVIFSPSVLDKTYSYLRSPKYADKVLFFSTISNDLLDNVRKIQSERFSEGETNDMLIICDDFGASRGYQATLNEMATNCRHQGISIWISYQYLKNATPTIRAQATDYLIFKITDKELNFLIEEGLHGFQNVDDWIDKVKTVINKQFKFVHISTRNPLNPYSIGFTGKKLFPNEE